MCSKAVRLNKIIIYYIQSFNCRVSCYCHPILTLLNCKMSNVEDFSNDGYDEAFDEAAGSSQYSIRTCPKCTLVDNLKWRQHNIASWLLFLSCNSCNVTWGICHDYPRNSL